MYTTRPNRQYSASREIGQAIYQIQNQPSDSHSSGAIIRVLPTMPRYWYRYTCPRCGCHVPSSIRFGLLSKHEVVCGYCGCIYDSRRAPWRRSSSGTSFRGYGEALGRSRWRRF